MKPRILKTFLAPLAVLSGICAFTGAASAFTYADTDLLLTFRLDPTRNDVTFNLGSVSNFLNKADGTQIVVTNWNKDLVLENFDGSLEGALVTVQAAVNAGAYRKAWLSVSSPGIPTDISGSQLSQIRSKVAGVGDQAAGNTSQSPTNVYVVSPNVSSSYSYIVSAGYTLPIPTLGGLAPGTTQSATAASTVEAEIPASLRFYEINPSSVTPKPAARQIGTFTLDANGVLKFTAGSGVVVNPPPPVPQIVSRSRAGNVFSLSFTTTNSVTYRLRYTDTAGLTTPSSNWTAGASIPGNGSTLTLQDTAAVPNRFYRLEATR